LNIVSDIRIPFDLQMVSGSRRYVTGGYHSGSKTERININSTVTASAFGSRCSLFSGYLRTPAIPRDWEL